VKKATVKDTKKFSFYEMTNRNNFYGGQNLILTGEKKIPNSNYCICKFKTEITIKHQTTKQTNSQESKQESKLARK